MIQNKAGRYAELMLKFSPKIRLCMLINVALIKRKPCTPLQVVFEKISVLNEDDRVLFKSEIVTEKKTRLYCFSWYLQSIDRHMDGFTQVHEGEVYEQHLRFAHFRNRR